LKTNILSTIDFEIKNELLLNDEVMLQYWCTNSQGTKM
jgi:hypothetical protein